LTGIRGEIRTDLELGEMQISIVGHESDNSWIVPDENYGDYYRLCLPGVYQLEIASGSKLLIIDDISISVEPSVIVNVITGTTIPGDVNGDNDINIADVLLIQNYITGQMIPSETEFEMADWNNDSTINQDDLDQIMQFLMNLYP